MHKTNIETLRSEAKRQLRLLKELLQKARDKGLVELPAQIKQNRATFDTESLPKILEVLDGESHKLEHLDMVIAVVGTMKAGKSTSINAIVGAEVLPNRNRPMTALPTLIRHTPGVLKPQLNFEKVKPLNDLLAVLHMAIKAASSETMSTLHQDKDMEELLEKIERQEPFSTYHTGEKEIFQFLKGLNDLVRLSLALKTEFPFTAYATVDSMPVIEVEFSHLKNTPATQGRLTLLDTPGPNEAGQQHLRHMLADQLKKASAVLAVLDYTQLKSDADAEVRKSLMEISDTAKGRIYMLVNKFDQKDRNSDDEETVKNYVARILMNNTMEEEYVYPVSSLRGYLASRVRNEIERHGEILSQEAWVEDFGQLSMGMEWDEEVAKDTSRIQKAASGLWKKSGFAAPLEKVIIEAYQNAALEALRSAASKLEKISKDAGDFFKANVGALKKSTDELQKNINNLQYDIENIAQVERETEISLQKALNGMKKDINGEAEKVQKIILSTLQDFLREGKEIEKNIIYKKNEDIEKRSKYDERNFSAPQRVGKKIGRTVKALIKSEDRFHEKENISRNQIIANAKNGVIAFDEKSKANDFTGKIEKEIRLVINHAENFLQICIENGINSFSNKLNSQLIESLKSIQKSAQKSTEGFDIELRLPKEEKLSLDTSISRLLKNAIETKTKTKSVTRNRRQDGVWGSICGWFGTDDWGWESYKDTEEFYEVNLGKISKSSREGIDILFTEAHGILDEKIYPQLNQNVEKTFGAFREKIEHVRGDLISGIQKHHRDQKQKAAILENSNQLKHEASGLEKDCTALNDSAETLRREEGISFARGEVMA